MMMRDHQANGTCSHTFGGLDTVRVAQMGKHLSTVYVRGWQSSSIAAKSTEPEPDIADYSYDTVPNKVDQLFRAHAVHDRQHSEARRRMTPEERKAKPPVDYFHPIIAEADTGHGGLTETMKIAKVFIENGAAGTKKCGHLGGKVLVSTGEQTQRFLACRLQQAGILNLLLVIVGRPDAEAATRINSNMDPVDHLPIKGATAPGVEPLCEAIRNQSDKALEEYGCMTSSDAVAKVLEVKGTDPAKWLKDSLKMSMAQLGHRGHDRRRDGDLRLGPREVGLLLAVPHPRRLPL
jgi:isocitrate lyase